MDTGPTQHATDRSAGRRDALAAAVADHLLKHGLEDAGLRALARAAGTSDRMLLYYFRDKDALLTAALGMVAARIEAALEALLPSGTVLPPDRLLAVLADAALARDLAPAMRLWIEVAARAARGAEPWRAAAGAIAGRLNAWIAARLDGPDADDQAARLLAILDGVAILDAVGRSDLSDRALVPRGADPS